LLVVIAGMMALLEWRVLRGVERRATTLDPVLYQRTVHIGAYAVGFLAIFLGVLCGGGPKAWSLAIAACLLALPMIIWFVAGMRRCSSR
jgi:hypothetical protein